jgi:streptogramin lyase
MYRVAPNLAGHLKFVLRVARSVALAWASILSLIVLNLASRRRHQPSLLDNLDKGRLQVERLEDRDQPSTGGITVTGSNYLVSEDNNVLLVNSLTGAVVATYATGVENDGAVVGPDGTIYVADYTHNRILHYSADGTLLATFGSSELESPQGLNFGPDGNLYVTNSDNSVRKFSSTGAYLGIFIYAGTGGLDNPKAIVWGPDGNAYVTSYYNNLVYRFNGTTGNFMNLFTVGSGGLEDLTFGPNGNLYVASYRDNVIERFNGTTGAFLGDFTSGDTLDNPYGLRFDSAGNLDVTSRSSGQIVTFNGTTGAYIHTLVSGLVNPSYMTDTTALVTSETGTSETFQLALTSQPTANVTIHLATSLADEGSLSQTSVTFTPTNWNSAQNITVTGLDNPNATGNETYEITGTAISADSDYSNLSMAPITVVNTFADLAGFSITPTYEAPDINGPWVQTSKSGASGTFTLALTSKPLDPVTIQFTSTDPSEASLSTSSLTFSTTDWNTPQTVIVTGKNDGVNSDTDYYINGIASSSDAEYNNLSMTKIYVSNFSAALSTYSIAETGTSTSFSFALPVQPTSPVTINYIMSVANEATLSTSTVTYTPSNWNVPQSITVTGLGSTYVSGDTSFLVVGMLSSQESSYNGVITSPAPALIRVANVAAAPTTLSTTYAGTQASFSVSLTSKPTAPVTVALSMSVAGPGSLSKSTLTFTPNNWNDLQTVTVTGQNDRLYNGEQTYEITGTSTSTDLNFNNQSMSPVTVSNVEPGSLPPVANNNSYQTAVNTPLHVPASGVLGNDTDPQNLSLTPTLIAGPAHGTLILNSDGSFTYTPQSNCYGTDSFTYRDSDGLKNSNVATVTITITITPVGPVIDLDGAGSMNDTAIYHAGSAPVLIENATSAVITDATSNTLISLQVKIQNPHDGSNEVLAADTAGFPITSSFSGGILTLSGLASLSDYQQVLRTITYEDENSNPDTSAIRNISFVANDGVVTGCTATTFLTVRDATDLAPTATDDRYTTNVNTGLSVPAPGVLVNDTDPQSLPLTAQLVRAPSHGTVTLNSDGSFTYIPDPNYFGSDSFTYEANDGVTNSNIALVHLTINALAPVANNQSYSTGSNESLNVPATGVLANDTDPQDLPLQAILVDAPSHGSLTLNTDGSFTYIPNTNYYGPDSFTYVADDELAQSSPATVTLAVIPRAPIASDLEFSTTVNEPLSMAAPGVLAGATDPQGLPLDADLTSGPSHGSLTLEPNGSWTYQPNTNFFGTDSFTYVANDGLADSAPATVSILVKTLAPVASGAEFSTNVNENLNVSAPGLLANATDPQGLPIDTVLVSGPSHGSLRFNTDGSFTYIPDTDYVGTDAFTYVVNDGLADSSPATVSLTVHPLPPVAENDSYSTTTNEILNVAVSGVLSGDSDPQGLPLTATLVSGPTNGSVQLNSDGTFRYHPNKNFHGTDEFTYLATDQFGDSNLAVVSLTISSPPVSIPPRAPVSKPTSLPLGGSDYAPIVTNSTLYSATTTPIEDVTSPSMVTNSHNSDPLPGRLFASFFKNRTAVLATGSPVDLLNDLVPTKSTNLNLIPPAPASVAALATPLAVVPLVAAPSPMLDFPTRIVTPLSNAFAAAEALAEADPVFTQLDQLTQEISTESQEHAFTNTLIVGGVVATAGSVVMNTRMVYWFLSALLARPALWRRFDPLDVIYAWERERVGMKNRLLRPEDNESLQSLVQ